MNWKAAEWILEIQRKTQALNEAAGILDNDVRESSFDLQEARACFEDVKEVIADLDQLLAVEVEELEEEEEEQVSSS